MFGEQGFLAWLYTWDDGLGRATAGTRTSEKERKQEKIYVGLGLGLGVSLAGRLHSQTPDLAL